MLAEISTFPALACISDRSRVSAVRDFFFVCVFFVFLSLFCERDALHEERVEMILISR